MKFHQHIQNRMGLDFIGSGFESLRGYRLQHSIRNDRSRVNKKSRLKTPFSKI